MAEHHKLGKLGEELALAHLRSKGYKILETNWRFGREEVDIIACDDATLVVVEVKTRSGNYFGEPEFAVTKSKQRTLIKAAEAYIMKNNIKLETRFDVISVILSPYGNSLNHIEDAFYPTH